MTSQRSGNARAAGLMLGYVLDVVLADPSRFHPVAGFGTTASAFERSIYRDSRVAGVVYAATLVGGVVALGSAVGGTARRLGSPAEVAVTALATWSGLGGTSLARTGDRMAAHVRKSELDEARRLLSWLCARDPSKLGLEDLTRASLESVAENTSDAAVGVFVWGALFGIPGILGYRAANTLDAMVGYRSPRYLRFGWAAARLDDVVNVIPARVTGILTVAAAPAIRGSASAAWTVWMRDASGHPSPNAGVAEASAAGALGVQLGGETQYAYGTELRPTLGSGRTPTSADLRRAVRLSRVVQCGAAATSAIGAVAIGVFGFGGRTRRHVH